MLAIQPVPILRRAALVLSFAAAAWLPAAAQTPTPAPPHNVVSLSASAAREVAMDWLTVTFSTTRDGSDAAAVQAQLRLALETALAEARKAARPGEVLVRTGAFALHPRYAPRGGITGWQGSAELVVEGRDTAAIAQLGGRIQTLTIGRVQWSLSRETRERVEAEVQAQAVAGFRERADALARAFGFTAYTLREASVGGGEAPGLPPQLMRAQAMRAPGADEALPVEAGRTLVSVTVNGSVQLVR
jgi:predicted secreted protein